MKPVVSIVLPVFNGESTIITSVSSLLDQTFQNFEIVIVDDGSLDNTCTKIRSIKDTKIIIHERDHEGIAKSLNFGINVSQGKYIARMDADDICLPDRLKKQVEYLDANQDVDLLATRINHIGPESSEGLKHHVDWQNTLLSHEEMKLNRFVDVPLTHPSVMARRNAFDKFGYYSEDNIPEDFELWLRWMHQGAIFHKLPDELLNWNDLPGRLTRTSDNYGMDKFYMLKAKYFALWLDQAFSNEKPSIWIIGTGKNVYRKSQWLASFDITINGYVDFKSRPSGSRKIISYDDLVGLDNAFFLSYVNDRAGRKSIRNYLERNGFQEGRHFYMMA